MKTLSAPILLCGIASIVCAAVAGTAAPKAPRPSGYEEHEKWVAQSLLEMQTIKVGMTRGELNKVFVGEGGLYSSASQTFLYRGCPYFKVHVGFKPAGEAFGLAENPKDKIVSLSEPFVNTTSQPN